MRATDVVCGKGVDTVTAQKNRMASEHKGEVFYFCSAHCKRIFDASPQQFLLPRLMQQVDMPLADDAHYAQGGIGS